MSFACPSFILPSTSGTDFQLDTHPKPLVMYFYPKDNTPGCTNESIAFRDLYPAFQAIGADIVGISRDHLDSHKKFKAQLALPFELLSDKDETVCKLFNVLKKKTLYGKQHLGIERSTFVIGNDGHIVREWRNVKVDGHAKDVLSFVQSL